MLTWLRPTEGMLSEDDTDSGLRDLLFDGMCSQVMGVLTGGAFLVAFSLLLGASNAIIGLLAAIGPLTQVFQIPAIFLVDRTGARKALVIVGLLFGRLFLALIAAIPWLVPQSYRVPLLLAALFAYFGLSAISGCAFNSWIRDLIPEKVMGGYFAQRMAISIALGAALSMVAGTGVDFYEKRFASPIGAYSILFAAGGASGLLGLFFLSRIPEPRMAAGKTTGLLAVLSEPFKDHRFRQLLVYLGSWNFAISLAAPFFAVYMIQRLEQSMSSIMALSVVSQLMNVLFLRLWGRLADRFTNKSVLTVSAPLFILSIALWPFTTMPEQYFLTIPILVAIHVLGGVSAAGVALCSGNIALKAAPRGKATAYLATNALVSGLAATLAPIVAGLGADWFASQELSVTLKWTNPIKALDLPAISLRGLDFLFIISVLFGLYALHRLATVREEGEVEEQIVVSELQNEVRKAVRHVSTVAGVRELTYFPFARLAEVVSRRGLRKDAP